MANKMSTRFKPKFNIKKGDTVTVLSGEDKGKTAKVVKAFPAEGKVLVEGVNMTKKHERARQQGGKGQVIAGWDQGVSGMKVGGRRRITIPPMLAYGKRGAGGVIGPDETLVFVVDLIATN